MKFVTGLVCLAAMTVTMAMANAAKLYDVRINTPSVMAGKDLPTGDYRLEVDGGKAVFHGKKENFECAAKMEEGSEKFGATTVRYSMAGGKYRIDEIHLGGTRMKVIFTE